MSDAYGGLGARKPSVYPRNLRSFLQSILNCIPRVEFLGRIPTKAAFATRHAFTISLPAVCVTDLGIDGCHPSVVSKPSPVAAGSIVPVLYTLVVKIGRVELAPRSPSPMESHEDADRRYAICVFGHGLGEPMSLQANVGQKNGFPTVPIVQLYHRCVKTPVTRDKNSINTPPPGQAEGSISLHLTWPPAFHLSGSASPGISLHSRPPSRNSGHRSQHKPPASQGRKLQRKKHNHWPPSQLLCPASRLRNTAPSFYFSTHRYPALPYRATWNRII